MPTGCLRKHVTWYKRRPSSAIGRRAIKDAGNKMREGLMRMYLLFKTDNVLHPDILSIIGDWLISALLAEFYRFSLLFADFQNAFRKC